MIMIKQILSFLSLKKDYRKIEKKNDICINVFYYENDSVFPVHVTDEKLEKCMDLLLKTDENNSRYIYVKVFNTFICNKTKNENKKHLQILFTLF